MTELRTISASELAELESNGTIDLIDVRIPIEFRSVHIEYARNVPLDSLDPEIVINNRRAKANDPIYLICQSGSRGAKGCQKFIDAGFTNVINVEGGTTAWDKAGLAVIRGKQSISLERQVRIVVGLVVLTSSVLALTVHPYFGGMAAMMGAGLTFAGVTDTCMLGMAIAKMPWNRIGTAPQVCAVQVGQ